MIIPAFRVCVVIIGQPSDSNATQATVRAEVGRVTPFLVVSERFRAIQNLP